MSGQSSRHFSELQERLAQARAEAAVPAPATDVVFVVAGTLWTLPSAVISSLALATTLLPVAAHEGMPLPVVGLVHAEGDVLTVVDAAIITSGAHSTTTSRSRLICLSPKSAHGFALLVDRVLERVPAGAAPAGTREFDLNALLGAL